MKVKLREILFVLYLLLFGVYITIDFMLVLSLIPSMLVSYWLLKDDMDLEHIFKEVEKLQQQIEQLQKK